jgi:pimeloyl-ACP methyl ester carboxylesterase
VRTLPTQRIELGGNVHNQRRRWSAAAALAVVVMVSASCSSSDKHASVSKQPTTTTALIPAPAGLPAFYAVPKPLPSIKAGDLLKTEKVAAPGVNGDVYRVMYVSTTVHDAATPVTGLVVVPKGAPPAGGWPVVTWGHGTNGMADKCAPSLAPADPQQAQLANLLLAHGWAVTASDYQGEGTPGLLPYIAGDSAARNVIDIVRAARQLPGAHLSTNYVVWGHSEGGQTAMYALKIGPTYAKDLQLKGVVAGAPPSQFNLIYVFLKGSPYRYYLLMAAGGLNTAYGDREAPLEQVLTPAGMKLLPLLDQYCAGGIAQHLGNVDIATVSKGDPFENELWRKVLDANDPQQFKTPSAVPLLMIQGGADEQIPPISTKILAAHLCSIGQDLERWIYPGQTHAGVIGPSANDMVHWMKDRFSNGANPDPYNPNGLANIDVTRCPK